jgi:hypothetical protein
MKEVSANLWFILIQYRQATYKWRFVQQYGWKIAKMFFIHLTVPIERRL